MRKFCLFICALFFSLNVWAAAETYYVTPSGAGLKDGSDWENAFGLSEWVTDITVNSEDGDLYYVYSGTYALTTSVSCLSGALANYTQVIGISDQDLMTEAQGDDRPLISQGAYDWDYNAWFYVKNIRHTMANVHGVLLANYTILENSSAIQTATGSNRACWNGLGSTRAINCYASGAQGSSRAFGFGGMGTAFGCVVADSDYGFHTAAVINCILDTISTEGIRSTPGTISIGNDIYNSRIGIEFDDDGYGLVYNNIIHSCSIGMNQKDLTSGKWANLINNNTFYNNTIDISTDDGVSENTEWKGLDDVALDPEFTDAANGDFTVGNNMQAIGFPSTMPDGINTSYVDLGALQVENSGGGETTTVNVCQDSAFYGSAWDTNS